MKKLITGIFAITVMFFVTPAMAIVSSTGDCNTEYGCPPGAVGIFTLEDMGQFVGGVWQWNQDFVDAADGQFQGANPDWQVAWAPYTNHVSGGPIDARMDRRIHANSDHDNTRIAFKMSGAGTETYIPIIWNAGCRKDVCTGDPEFPECFSEPVACDDPTAEYQDFMMACEPCGTGADGINFQLASSDLGPAADPVSLTWNGVAADPVLYAAEITDIGIFMKYNNGMRFWDIVDEWRNDREYRYRFMGVDPILGENHLVLTTSDGVTHDLVFLVESLKDMPKIPAKTEDVMLIKTKVIVRDDDDDDDDGRRRKKVRTRKKTIEVDNITVREIEDPMGGNGIVVQWSEPDGALFGGKDLVNGSYQLRVYIGKANFAWGNINPTDPKEAYLWIDCPAQIGTVVASAEQMDRLRGALNELGLGTDNIEVFLTYRESFWNNHPSGTAYTNRGLSESVYFTPTP